MDYLSLRTRGHDFNTSHVTVYLNFFTVAVTVSDISIHLMLLFIDTVVRWKNEKF